jgi:D-alanyl-D-alanine carboxypeptidase
VQSTLPDVDLSGLHVVRGVDHGPNLTIRQLLFQTSGLAECYEGGVAADQIQGKDYA